MKEFKVGERVSVRLDDDKVYRGAVKKLMPYGNLQLDLLGSGSNIIYPIVHPNQCRRLVKRSRWMYGWFPPNSEQVGWCMAWAKPEHAECATGIPAGWELVKYRRVKVVSVKENQPEKA